MKDEEFNLEKMVDDLEQLSAECSNYNISAPNFKSTKQRILELEVRIESTEKAQKQCLEHFETLSDNLSDLAETIIELIK